RGNDPAVEGNAAWTGFRFTRFEVTPAGIRDGYTNSFPIAVYTNGEDIAAKDDWNLVQAMTYQTYESEAFFQEHASGDQGSLRLNGSAVRQAVLLYDQTICANAFRAKVGIEGMNHSRRAGLAFNWQSAVDCEENISGYIFQLVGRHSSGGTNYVRLLKYLAADEAADGQSPEVDGSTVIELLGWTAATTGYTLPEPGTDEWIPITLGVSSDGDGRFLLSVEHGLNAGGARRTWEVNDPGPVLRGGFVGMAVQRGKVNNTNIWQDATENDGNWAAALFDDFILLPPLRGSVIVVR
ncbi:MAG: hypothetical protein JW951_04745, partial [Lentisphaerae bacterium]|nr:hypothetical protein [Lentisphaerota bacterium]